VFAIQALLLHNHIMRKCSYAHAGYILEQEGDAFTIAFHTPSDAVAFTLQV
jgi:class 3 adenylate cyclase